MTRHFKISAAAAFLAAALASPVLAQGDAPGGGPTGAAGPKPMSGEQIFHETCAACHMHDAKGATGAAMIPSLAANPRMGTAAYPITIVSTGKGAMPSFAPYLTKAQIAAVITYVRTNFGNSYAKPVTEDEVAKIWASYGRR
jgi:mono/diheme cytochrome c family protein